VDEQSVEGTPLSLSRIGKTILAGASAAFVLRAGGAGLKYLMEVLFARWLGTEAYGAFAYAYNWAQLLSIVAGLGLVTATLRFVPAYEVEEAWGRLRGLVGWSQRMTVGAGLLLAGLGVSILWAVSYEHWITLVFGLASIIPMALIAVQSSLMRGLKQMTAAFFGRYILWPVGSIGAVFLLLRATKMSSGAIATGGVALALTVIALGQIGLIRWVFPDPVWAAEPDQSLARRWFLVSMPLLLMSGFQMVLNRADVVMVGTLLGATEAGLYNAGARTARLLSFLLSAFNAIAAPMISEYWAQRDREGLEALFTGVIQWVFWPSVVLAVGLFAFGGPILRIFGPEFDIAWGVLVLVGVGQLINAVTGPVGYLMGLTGHERATAWVYGVSAGANVGLNLLLVPPLGLMGGAIATMISVALQNLWLVGMMRNRVGINIFAVWGRAFLFRR
jgi:O-antigen/teichoic acid export membrane protein